MKTLAYSPTLIFTPEAAAFKYWTVKEYRQMSELSILDTDDRTELIEGQILGVAELRDDGSRHRNILKLEVVN